VQCAAGDLMIVGIGVDIVEHERIARIHDRYHDKFAMRILDRLEMNDYRQAPSPVRFLAKRFAAKEAASKALGTGFSSGITLNAICVRHDDKGKPVLELSGTAAAYADKLGATALWLSISDEEKNSVAMVILER
jgi:holo-[acyl-carrier protein] synthase